MEDRKLSEAERLILEYVKEHGPVSRDELVDALNMPRTSIYDRIMRMRKMGYPIVKRIEARTSRGRPHIFFAYDEEVGVDSEN